MLKTDPVWNSVPFNIFMATAVVTSLPRSCEAFP